jgi:ubiquinone/menaquinone biosynthesis C-methylase UbiE
MDLIRGKRIERSDPQFREIAARFSGRVFLDLGTGDGRLPFTMAREAPGRLFIGLDANAAGARELSGRAFRARMPNLLYVRAAVENLPAELAGLADRVSIRVWNIELRADHSPVVLGDDDGGRTGRCRAVGPGREV